jgi:hypothetical protein
MDAPLSRSSPWRSDIGIDAPDSTSLSTDENVFRSLPEVSSGLENCGMDASISSFDPEDQEAVSLSPPPAAKLDFGMDEALSSSDPDENPSNDAAKLHFGMDDALSSSDPDENPSNDAAKLHFGMDEALSSSDSDANPSNDAAKLHFGMDEALSSSDSEAKPSNDAEISSKARSKPRTCRLRYFFPHYCI